MGDSTKLRQYPNCDYVIYNVHQTGDQGNTERRKNVKIKSNVRNIPDTLNQANYDIYKAPSKVKNYSVTIKETKRTIEWTSQPPNNRGALKDHQVLKGPVGKPQGKAKDAKTPLAGILI